MSAKIAVRVAVPPSKSLEASEHARTNWAPMRWTVEELVDSIFRAWSALPVEVIALLCLLPIVEPILDLWVFNTLLAQSYFSSAVLLLAALVLHWRTCTLYAALKPQGSVSVALTLYAPFLLLPNWGCIAGDEVSEADLTEAYDNASQAPKQQSPISFAAPVKEQRTPAVSLPPLKLQKLKMPSPPPSPPEQGSAEDAVAPREQAKVPLLPLESASSSEVKDGAEDNPSFSPDVAISDAKLVRGKFMDISRSNASPRIAATKAAGMTQHQQIDEMSPTAMPAVAAAAAAGAAAAAAALAAEASSGNALNVADIKKMRVLNAKSRELPVLATPLRGRARKRSPGAGTSGPNYGFEAAIVSALVEQHLSMYESQQGDLVRQLSLLLVFEAKVTCLSMVIGPMLLWRAALALFRGTYMPSNAQHSSYSVLDMVTPRYEAHPVAEDRLMHCRTLLIMQAAFQSLPQVVAQTSILVSCRDGLFSVELYLLSATCSLSVATFAFMSFAQHRRSLFKLAPLQADDVAANLARRSEMSVVDSACLLADIAAAREVGVPNGETHPAVLKLRDQRVAQARALHQNGCLPQMLFDAGYKPTELCAAGVSAGELRDAGLWLAQLEELGFPLRELRDSGHSTAALHAAGHGVHELVEAGASATELKALRSFAAADMRGAGLSAAALRAAGYSVEELRTGGYSGSEMKQAGWTAKELRGAGCSPAELQLAGCSVFELKAAGFANAELQTAGCEGASGCSSAPNFMTNLLLEGPSASSSRTSGFGGPAERKQVMDGKLRKVPDRDRDENTVYTKLPPNFPDDTSTSWLNNRVVPPDEHRPMPPRTPAPIYNISGQQVNQQYWSHKTMGYVGTNAFAR